MCAKAALQCKGVDLKDTERGIEREKTARSENLRGIKRPGGDSWVNYK